MSWWNFWKRHKPLEIEPATLEQAGDELARDVVKMCEWMSDYAPGGVPDWFDKHLRDVHRWWRFRK